MNTPSSTTIANTFLEVSENTPISRMKLSKLVYFTHAFSLAILDQPAHVENYLAFDWGPVERNLFDSLRFYGSGNILYPIKEAPPLENPELEDLIKAVWNVYEKYSCFQLAELTTRKLSPWYITWKSFNRHFQTIPNDLIKSHYKGILQK